MEQVIRGHLDCVGCEHGFLLRGHERRDGGGELGAEIELDARSEGWKRIPHGGFGMGALWELVSGLGNFPSKGEEVYPLTFDFKLGGAKAALGERLRATAEARDGGASARLCKDGERDPYLAATVTYMDSQPVGFSAVEGLPVHPEERGRLVPLPRYTDCLVCGTARQAPGLERGFSLFDGGERNAVVTFAGFEERDRRSFGWFRRGPALHPMALFAVLDEAMGWGGFFCSAQGGVTVVMRCTLLRDVRVGERLVAVGRGDRVTGRSPRLMFFQSSGAILAIGEGGAMSKVATAEARYFVVAELTEQMRIHLAPEDRMLEAFRIAERNRSLATQRSPG